MTALARAVVRFRYYIIAFWLIVAALAIPRAARVTDVLETGGQSHRFTEAQLTRDIILESFERPIVSFMAVVVTGPVPIDSQTYHLVLETLSDAARREPYIDQVVSYLTRADPGFVSDDRRTTFFIATVAAPYATNAGQVTPWLRAAMNRGAARIPGAARGTGLGQRTHTHLITRCDFGTDQLRSRIQILPPEIPVPRRHAPAASRMLQGFVLQPLGPHTKQPPHPQQELLVRRHYVGHRLTVVHVAVEPQSAVQRVLHPLAAPRELEGPRISHTRYLLRPPPLPRAQRSQRRGCIAPAPTDEPRWPTSPLTSPLGPSR